MSSKSSAICSPQLPTLETFEWMAGTEHPYHRSHIHFNYKCRCRNCLSKIMYSSARIHINIEMLLDLIPYHIFLLHISIHMRGEENMYNIRVSSAQQHCNVSVFGPCIFAFSPAFGIRICFCFSGLFYKTKRKSYTYFQWDCMENS